MNAIRMAAGNSRFRTLGRVPLGLALLALAWAIAAGVAGAAKDDLSLVSRIGTAGAKGDGDSSRPSVSEAGLVAFESRSANLHPDDGDPLADVLLKDPVGGGLTLLSRAAGADGEKGNGVSVDPSISADGRHVAFASGADNIHPDDPDTGADVYVRDLETGALKLVSRASDSTKGNGDSSAPAISADGRFVAFASTATNLHPDDPDPLEDVYLHDLATGATTLVSRAAGADGEKGNGASGDPSISADGGFVGFTSAADNLDPDDGDPIADVYVRDLAAARTILVSRADGVAGAKSDAASGEIAVSGSGRWAVFSSAGDLGENGGAFEQIYLRDLVADEIDLVSRAAGTGEAGNGNSGRPQISRDGRFVAFATEATNLHPDDSEPGDDVLIGDLESGTAVLASRAAGPSGSVADGVDDEPALSPAGRYVAFRSTSTNLDPVDTTTAPRQVYLRDVLGPECGDGLDNDGDGAADFPDDPGCLDRSDPSEANPDLSCAGLAATRIGTEAADTIVGQPGRDVIVALGGDDLIDAAGGDDVVCSGSGNDLVAGGPGSDTVFGEGGDDVLAGGDGADSLAGGGGDDRLFGEAEGDRLLGGRGDDRMFGAEGIDLLRGGPGSDLVNGGADGDRLYGAGGADRIVGGQGRDVLNGGVGSDRLFGGPGPDRLIGRAGADRLFGNGGRDSGFGGPGRDLLNGGPGPDQLAGNGGRDKLVGRAGRDVLNGGGGPDRAYGGPHADRVLGGIGRDRIYGNGGPDTLFGQKGDDLVNGGPGRDSCQGNAGRDRIRRCETS